MGPQAAPQQGSAPQRRLAVRPASVEDAEALARLSLQLGYPSSREEVERRLGPLLGQPGHAVLIAEAEREGDRAPGEGTQVVGWIHGFVERTVESDPTVEIGGLVVDEAWRGRGVGRLLMAYVERWARSVACNTVTVRSNVTRERSHAFYQTLGYAAVKSQQVFRKTVAEGEMPSSKSSG